MRPTDIATAHLQHELAWVASGHARITCPASGVELTVDADHAAWVPAGTRHAVTPSRDALILPVWFDTLDVPSAPARPTSVDRSERLDSLVRTLLQPSLYPLADLRTARRELVAEVDRAAHGSAAPPLPGDPRARRIAEAILEHPADRRGADEWAHSEHICTKTLLRLFHQGTGISFDEWRREARLTTAAHQLRTGSQVASVAVRCGYASPAAFSTAFSRRFGTTPAAHRRRWAA